MRTLLIPGLGADAGLFAPQARASGDELVVVTPSFNSMGMSLPDAARQMASRLEADGLLDEPYALGGMSFGGSMALEVARVATRPPERLMLIASNRTSDTIPAQFHIGRRLGSVVPQALTAKLLPRLAGLFAWRDGLNAEGKAWLTNIASRTDVPLLLWGARAIGRWRFTDADAEALDIPIHQIHGERDWVLPLVERHTTTIVPGGRHLINWSYANLVNDWLSSPPEL